MNNKRPIHLNPLAMRLPLPAWISITHRLSGILVFLLIPLMMWGFHRSLASPESFNQVKDVFFSPLGKFFIWALLSGLVFHLCAGIRHLLMDMHWGDSLKGGRRGAKLVLIIATFLIIALAFWVWS